MIVLDTNILSELMRPAPGERIVRWMAARPASDLYTTSITQAEILLGIYLLPAGRRRRAFEAAAEAMFSDDFEGRILDFDGAAARLYARIVTGRRRSGRPISHFDAQIAAIARSAGAPIVTRNVADYEGCDIEVINPWTS